MKKRVVSCVLAASLFMGSASAAFIDISNNELAKTAAVLQSMKIMEGVGGSRFEPKRSLTRAEFSRLLVAGLGITDVTAYKNYTIFPDVRSSHWAAGYVNAAIKHPDVEKKKVIHGYADGTFKPDRTINYGEVCTMLLLMMGYTIEDIGPMWPGDYIARAKSIGLTNGVSAMGPTQAVTRADAAAMLLNAVSLPGKEGAILLDQLLTKGTEDVILLATAETNSELHSDQALFYAGGEIERKGTVGTLDSALIGVKGTTYFSRIHSGLVQTLIPDRSGRTEENIVKSASYEQIEMQSGVTVKPDRTTDVFVRGEVHRYAEAWFDLLPGDKITLSYGESGKLQLISVKAASGADTFVYGTESAAPIPSGYRVMKNGIATEASQLQRYDVITLDRAGKTAIVSDKRITGAYENGLPSFKSPDKVKVLGEEFVIAPKAIPYFAGLRAGEQITLLLDSHGAVAAAYPASDVRAEMIGVMERSADGEQIALFNGITLKHLNPKPEEKLIGKVVLVTQDSKGMLSYTERSNSSSTVASWKTAEGKMGSNAVSTGVRVWEQLGSGAPLFPCSVSALPAEVPASKIRYVHRDTAGTVTAVILSDVTGEAWNYGFAYFSEEEQPDGSGEFDPNATVTFKTMIDGEAKTLTYRVIAKPIFSAGEPIGIPKGMELNTEKQMLPTKKIERVDTVALTAFDGENGVRTSSGYYELGDNCVVYLSGQNKFVTLRQAKGDYTNFTLYADAKSEYNRKIRMISVS